MSTPSTDASPRGAAASDSRAGTWLSINQATTETTPTADLLRACADAHIRGVSLWRHKYIDNAPDVTRRALDHHDITATSLCRGGFFTGTRPQTEADEDNRRAVEEAATLGAPVLVLVCGPVTANGMADAESKIADGISRLLPYALEHGITLAVEPFHPMLAAERSAIVTLRQAANLVARLDHPNIGIALDTYHVWWDPELDEALRAIAERIVSVHVGDWLVPTPDLLAGRGLPGDGVIDLPGLITRISQLGYAGPLEVEVLNPQVWARPVREVLADIARRMQPMFSPTQESGR